MLLLFGPMFTEPHSEDLTAFLYLQIRIRFHPLYISIGQQTLCDTCTWPLSPSYHSQILTTKYICCEVLNIPCMHAPLPSDKAEHQAHISYCLYSADILVLRRT